MDGAVSAILLLVALLAVACLALLLWWRSGAGGRLARTRARRAARGEVEAERLLRSMGYIIFARQAVRHGTLWVDGVPTPVQVRADLLVWRDGRRFVAEVKTGLRGASPTWPGTRRQLLEYGRFFPGHGLLLVLPEAGRVHALWFDAHGAGGAEE